MPFDPDYAAQVLRTLAERKQGITLIFGAGRRTSEVLSADPAAARRAIDAVVDDDASRHGSAIAGIPIRSPDTFLSQRVATVVICSEMFERELTKRAIAHFGRDCSIITAFDRTKSLASALAHTEQLLRDNWNDANDREALWLNADRLMSALRTTLETTPEWRYGPQRQLEEFRELCQALGGAHALRGKSILNAGCGRYHPLGQSILALLAGASRAHAIDIEAPLDEARSARATLDIIAHLLLVPRPLPEGDGRGQGSSPRSEALTRIEPHIDLAALAHGHYTTALRPTGALAHHVADITDATIAPGPWDIIISRDVFEHIHDVATALAALHERLAPGGTLIAWIDFSDHRRYANPQKFAHWSSLTPDAQADNSVGRGDTNGLRFPHYLDLFTRTGFRVLRYEPTETQPIPAHVRPHLAPMYREMTDADLSVCRAVAVLERQATRQRSVKASGSSAARAIS